jgi:hypothetical protein
MKSTNYNEMVEQDEASPISSSLCSLKGQLHSMTIPASFLKGAWQIDRAFTPALSSCCLEFPQLIAIS